MTAAIENFKNIAITRDNTILLDGAGSQIQRNYCTYALSRLLGIAYVHSPLQAIPYQGLSALEKNEHDPVLMERYNQTFTIPSDIMLPKSGHLHRPLHFNLPFFQQLQEEAKKKKEFHLIQLGFPYSLTDQHPSVLDCIKELTPFKKKISPVFRIAIHVRRGDLFAVDARRMLPNSYYLTIAQQAICILNKNKIPFVCELYTELPTQSFVVTQEQYKMQLTIEEPVTITQERSALEDFEVLPNLQKFINGDPIEMMERMATADLLVISRSSFSYLPGLLNRHGLVIYHPFWHSAPPAWVNAHEQKLFEQTLDAYCDTWQRSYD